MVAGRFRSVIDRLLLDRMQKPPIPCRRMEEREPVAMRDEDTATPTPVSPPVKDVTREMTPAPLRVGVAGAGFIGAVHARSARLAGAHLAGVATSTPERSREAAERLGAEEGYATPEQLATA